MLKLFDILVKMSNSWGIVTYSESILEDDRVDISGLLSGCEWKSGASNDTGQCQCGGGREMHDCRSELVCVRWLSEY